MIMVNFDFLSKPICFEENQVNVLCVENPKLFRNICNSFIRDETEENNIVFSEEFIPFKPKGKICVINDFFGISYSNAIMKKLYEQIEKYCNNELQNETIRLKAHMVNFTEMITKNFDYDFEFDYEVNLTEVFKLMNLKPVSDKYEVLHTLIDYILILNKYAPPKCFVLINLHLYFTEDELESFYTDAINNHIRLLVVENKMFFGKNKYENMIIYDSDFCEIVENR